MKKLTFSASEEERITFGQLASHHPKEYFRQRGKALLALANGQDVAVISAVLQVNGQSIRNWARDWNSAGLVGILNARQGGRPAKLTEELIGIAVEAAKNAPMSLAQIAEHVRQQRPDAPTFSLDRLGARLRERGLSYKRTYYSLKKKRSGSF